MLIRVHSCSAFRSVDPRSSAVCTQPLTHQLGLCACALLLEDEIVMRRIHVDADRIAVAELAADDARGEGILDAVLDDANIYRDV